MIAAPIIAGKDHLHFQKLKSWCREQGLNGLYIEPGAGLMASLLQQGALDYLFHYAAPKVLADSEALSAYSGMEPESLDAAIQLKNVQRKLLGPDVLTRGAL